MNIKKERFNGILLRRGVFLFLLIFACFSLSGGNRGVQAATVKRKTVTTKKCYAIFKTKHGKAWKKVLADGKRKFPSADTGDGNMFLGWSTTKGHSKHPMYYADDVIPRKNAIYYMVVLRKSQNKAPNSIVQSASYDNVLFVGDSRTLGMSMALGTSMPLNVDTVCKGGAGIAWFKEVGYKRLVNKIQNLPQESKKAVIINFGVNDLNDYSEYPQYMKEVAKKLQAYGCDMYYMSINPINSAVIKKYRGMHRTEKQINDINKNFYTKLCSGSNKYYKYIDTYNYLRSTGWISNDRNDGVHYSKETYLRIYDYTIRHIGRIIK